MTQEKWAEKIAALLRKAESTTPEEAELLMAKAQELMEKYAIDEAMLRMTGVGEKDPVITEEFVITGIYRYPLSDLTYVILKNNGVMGVKITYGEWKHLGYRTIDGKLYKQTEILEAVGFKSDIARSRLLEASLHIQAMRAMSSWWAENEDRYSYMNSSQQHRQKRQFLTSFAQGVHTKLREATKRGREAAAEEHTTTGVEMVVRSKEMAVQDEFNRLHPDARKGKHRRKGGDLESHLAGQEAGRNADVGQPSLQNKNKQGIGR